MKRKETKSGRECEEERKEVPWTDILIDAYVRMERVAEGERVNREVKQKRDNETKKTKRMSNISM